MIKRTNLPNKSLLTIGFLMIQLLILSHSQTLIEITTGNPCTTAATPRFLGYADEQDATQATCVGPQVTTACSAGYAINPNENKACDGGGNLCKSCIRCDVGFKTNALAAQKCIQVTVANIDTVCSPTQYWNGQSCVTTPTSGAPTCAGNTLAAINAANSRRACIACQVGFINLYGRCQPFTFANAAIAVASCATNNNLFWTGIACQAINSQGNNCATGWAPSQTISNACTRCEFGYVPHINARATTCETARTICPASVTPAQIAYDGSKCVPTSTNFKCPDTFAQNTGANLQLICDRCNLGYLKSKGFCANVSNVCTSTLPVYDLVLSTSACVATLTSRNAVTNALQCSDGYYANTNNTNLCTACDFGFVLYQGTCQAISSTTCNTTNPDYDGTKCVLTANGATFKCLNGYYLEPTQNNPGKYCKYCDIGYIQKKGGCFDRTLDCKDSTPYFNGLACVGTTDFKCVVNDTFGYHANEQSPTKCIYCEIGYTKKLSNGIIQCQNLKSSCLNLNGQIFNGIACGPQSEKCKPGYTFLKGSEKLCTICDIGYKKINGSCIQTNCTNDKPKFDGLSCNFAHVNCAEGYTASRTNPNYCTSCALGYQKQNGTCIKISCPTETPKWDGTKCVLANVNCSKEYTLGTDPNVCSVCAANYTSDSGRCIDACPATKPKWSGADCRESNATCTTGFKNNGLGTCIPTSQPCADGYFYDGARDCAKSCATNLFDNGIKVCVAKTNNTIPCASGFTFVNGACSILSQKSVLASAPTNLCDPLCLRCDGQGVCTTCRVGYTLTAAKRCVKCVGCQTCDPTNQAICTSCFSPQVLSSDTQTCVSVTCPASCVQCNIAGRCLQCIPGFTPAGDGSCAKCSVQNCTKCSSSSLTTCSDCAEGTFLSSASTCTLCTVGCSKCKAQDISACDGCVAGYYPSTDANGINRCYQCMKNCSKCSSADSCTQCKQGYILSSDGKKCTLRCNQNCATCDETNPNKCLSCFANFNYNQNASKCEINLACNTSSTCTVCPAQTVLKDKQCLKCTVQIQNCNICLPDSLTQCAGCIKGFYLQEKACIKCNSACNSCVSKDICLNCTEGFYLVSSSAGVSGVCASCDKTCLTCAQVSTKCTSCRNTSTLVGFNCISLNNVVVEMKLSTDIDKFITVIEAYRKWIVDQANKGLGSTGFNKNQLYITNVTKGSTNVLSTLSVDDPTKVTAISNGIASALAVGAKIGDASIESGRTVTNFGPSGSPSTTEESSSSKLGLILGLTIPLGLLFIVAVIVIVYKLIQRRKNEGNYKDNTAVKNYSSKNLETGDRYEEKV